MHPPPGAPDAALQVMSRAKQDHLAACDMLANFKRAFDNASRQHEG